ncbi:hypothetical protein TSAR_005518 [Trichomalopsis sarcophagae]|uniref:Uncharacterized protein n=1 Tax=Trichomalopsis sarcophagae TaxID=543379 RepID=A0A232EHP6_9HYME|nr:hypothetical protein TSAR_005518 [Trichomalopsis sarcophagae]
MEDDASEKDKDSSTAREDLTTAEMTKRGRGRPKKDAKDKEQAKQMKNFLEKGNCGYDVTFGSKTKVEHSPIRDRDGKVNEDKADEKYQEHENGTIESNSEGEGSLEDINEENGKLDDKQGEKRGAQI